MPIDEFVKPRDTRHWRVLIDVAIRVCHGSSPAIRTMASVLIAFEML